MTLNLLKPQTGTPKKPSEIRDNMQHLLGAALPDCILPEDDNTFGFKITPQTGLTVRVGVGRGIIGKKYHDDRNYHDITLPARRACLLYKLKNTATDSVTPIDGCVQAQFPTASTQTLRYILDGATPIANSGTGGTNAATKTGVVADTDGRIGYSGLGSTTGYYTCASNTGVPPYNSDSTRLLIIDSFVSNGAIQIFHNDGISKFGCTAANNLTVNGVDTLFTLENGGAYVITLPSNASTISNSVYVNGVNVNTGNYITNTTAVAPTFYSGAGGASKSPSQLAYFEYYTTKLTPAQIAQISNTLLLPCTYDGVNIRSILPPNSISLGYAKTSSTAVVEIDSDSYKYGVRQGATGGNRKVFLGWKYFSGATTLKWDNPFGTRKVKTYYAWSQDANGANESDIIEDDIYSSSNYGLKKYNTSSQRLSVITSPNGATHFNGIAQTTGYIGCYVEVIE